MANKISMDVTDKVGKSIGLSAAATSGQVTVSGGASANAVTALLALERALKKSLSASERLRIAEEVGSDVPLFLIGGTVLGMGRGERVYPLEDFPATACVVVTPDVGVSTPRAFAVLRLITRANFVGRRTGKSAGFSPLRMRPA